MDTKGRYIYLEVNRMGLKFVKMHGLGNDFIVINAINTPIYLNQNKIKALADRHTWIGFDQCLVIEKNDKPNVDFKYRIFNANGAEVGQCGNGARCVARFVAYYHLTSKSEITLATNTTTMNVVLNADKSATVSMGLPQWEPHHIPLLVAKQQDLYTMDA